MRCSSEATSAAEGRWEGSRRQQRSIRRFSGAGADAERVGRRPSAATAAASSDLRVCAACPSCLQCDTC